MTKVAGAEQFPSYGLSLHPWNTPACRQLLTSSCADLRFGRFVRSTSAYQDLLRQHHYLGSLPKISETLWYIATWCEQWVALLSFTASALKCAARNRWIGWDFRHQYRSLKLAVNNSRFLILTGWHVFNLRSRVLSLCQRRLSSDWDAHFGHPVLLLETFVDP